MKKIKKVNFKDSILNINLATQTAPKVSEQAGKDWVEYGTDDWSNLYPQFLIDLYYNSSTHAAIINATRDMIAGEGILIEQNEDIEGNAKLQQFLDNANGRESLHDVIKKLAFDYKLQGGFAINVIWNKTRTGIAEIHHLPVERIRAGKPNNFGVVDTYYVSADWNDLRNNPATPIPAFNTNDRVSPSQIIYDGDYSPNMDIYFTPDYSAACNWCLVDQKVAEFHLSNISNGFSGSYFVNFANGVPTQEERTQIENSLINKFSGAAASGKIVLTFSDDVSRVPQITPIAVSNADKQYLALQELLVQNILTGHRVTSPMLMGIKNESGLGSNVDELNSAFEVYLNTVVKPYQNKILRCISKILKINNIYLPLEIIQNKPITSKFTLEDMKSVMTQDEIREELGLPPLETNEMVDEDEYTEMSNNDTLTEWIEAHGEDSVNEDWELISDEIVDGEHEDFDYESELNELHKMEFASTGTARPNSKSSDEGIDREYNLYKVRYRYSTAISAGNSREFCTKMLSSNKLYRKEDIRQLDNKPVNKGWGIGGADTYSIWLYKGGGNCGHYWRREIYFYKLGVSTGNQIADATKVITTTEARSNGFYPETNESEVSRAPKNMPNNGFVNKK
tara:strand:- start:368 stop:2236 length:1869 start_codon:yes stop_codon:yes gene_type:complete